MPYLPVAWRPKGAGVTKGHSTESSSSEYSVSTPDVLILHVAPDMNYTNARCETDNSSKPWNMK